MTLPASGPISLNAVNVELGLAGTTAINMNQSTVRTLFGKASGQISMSDGYGKSNRVVSNITISSSQLNYVLNTAKASGYVAGKTDVTVTINSGVYVYSNSTGTAALRVDTSWAAGDTVTIINNGVIQGMGGNGGEGAGDTNSGIPGAGTSAGNGLTVQRATSINNGSGVIAGGGGGGGGGPYGRLPDGEGGNITLGGGGGGGGRTGLTNTSGGAGSGFGGGNGGAGTSSSAGSGGAGGLSSGFSAGDGGNGGGRGSAGATTSAMFGPGAAGGAGGSAVSGNSNITWIATGTRNGAIG